MYESFAAPFPRGLLWDCQLMISAARVVAIKWG